MHQDMFIANLAQRHLSEPRRWCNGISNVNPKWDLNFPKLFVSGWETKLRNYYILHNNTYIYIHTHNRKSFTTRKTINSCTVYTKLIDFSLLDPALLDRCCSRDPRSFTDPDFPVVKLTALTQDFDIPTSSDIQTVTLSNPDPMRSFADDLWLGPSALLPDLSIASWPRPNLSTRLKKQCGVGIPGKFCRRLWRLNRCVRVSKILGSIIYRYCTFQTGLNFGNYPETRNDRRATRRKISSTQNQSGTT